MEKVVVRRGGLADVAQIVAIHCSDLEDNTWYRFPEGKRVVAKSVSELNLYERWLNGGSWMSEELCAIYLNNLLLNGHIPLVAELDGKLVGELELFYGKENDGHLYAHIGVLQVHKEYQRQGIGTLLVQKAIVTAKKRGASYITVRPRDLVRGFYQDLGFDEWLKTVVFFAEAAPFVSGLTWKEDTTIFHKQKFWPFILGYEQSSAQIWQIFHVNQFALPEFTREPIHTGIVSGRGKEIVTIFYPHVYFGDMANVYAWSNKGPNKEDLWTMLTLAYQFGYDKVRSLLTEDKYEGLKDSCSLAEIERQEIFRLNLKEREIYEMAGFVC